MTKFDGCGWLRIAFGAWAFGALCVVAAGQAQAGPPINLAGKAAIVSVDARICVDAMVGSNREQNCNGAYHAKERLRFVGNKVLVDTLELTDSGNFFAGAARGLNTGTIFVIGETFDIRRRPDLPSSFRPDPRWDIKRYVVSARLRGRTLDLSGDIDASGVIPMRGVAYATNVQVRAMESLSLYEDSCSVSSSRLSIAFLLVPEQNGASSATAQPGKADMRIVPTSASCSIENGG